MINSEFRKKMADSWFSYLQVQICKSFEILEGNKLKFSKRDWYKKNAKEGGGTSYLLTKGKIFDKVGVNKSTVSGTFPKQFRSKILGAGRDGKYWASGISIVAHIKNGVTNIFTSPIEKKQEVLVEFFLIMKLKIGKKI